MINNVYAYRPGRLNLSRVAWLIGKVYSNDIYDFTVDFGKVLSPFGSSVKTRLKLSEKGLTCGGSLKGVLYPSRSPPNEDFELSRICDLYQDRNYSNVLICVVKSSRPEYTYEVFFYKLERSQDVKEFQDSFTQLLTTPDNQDQVDFGALNLSDPRRPGSTYGSNIYAKSGNFRRPNLQLRNSNRRDYYYAENNYLPVRKVILRDKGVQVEMERSRGNLDFFCERTKLHALNGSNVMLFDTSCMTSPSRVNDDFDGEVVVFVGANRNRPYSKEFPMTDDFYYHERDFQAPLRNDSYTTRGIRETQNRVLSFTSDGDPSEGVQLQPMRTSDGIDQRRGRDYVDYSHDHDRSDFRRQRRLNGDTNYYGRRHPFEEKRAFIP